MPAELSATTPFDHQQQVLSGPPADKWPLVVDLDQTFVKVDTLHELFAAALVTSPLRTIKALLQLTHGIAAFKQALSDTASLDIETLPVRADLLAYLETEVAAGRELHLATAADQRIAEAVAARFPIFQTVNGTMAGVNLKGANKAKRLLDLFPGGFAYAGDSTSDLPVWKHAKSAIVVSADRKLRNTVSAAGTPVEQIFGDKPSRPAVWLKALRPHQWMKNAIVLVPVALGWRDVTAEGLLQALIMVGLLCVVASMTYLLNDMADLAADRKHWSKRRRGFASGALPVRDGMLLVGTALPICCAAAFLVSPWAGVCLLFYVVVTLGYSFRWKRIPLFDTFIIALLFTIRLLIGIAAADLMASAWLLTFSMFFFFSLALAKRHTEILRSAEHGLKNLEGRGYQAGDESLTLAFGTAAAMASIVIVVLYLVEEIFARQIYHTPAWLWVAPIAIFLFSCRIWVLSHRGRMTDDPVAFALRDNVSIGLGCFVGVAILLAL